MKTKRRFISLALSLMLTSGAALAANLKVGVSMAQFDDNFLNSLRQSMDAKAKAEGLDLQFVDATSDVVKQLNQVETFVNQKVDAIIVTPVDTAATAKITKAAHDANIPLIYVNRRPDVLDLPKGVVVVASNDLEAGEMQMEYLAKKMNGKGNIVIMLGDLANNSTRNRTKGNEEILAKYPDIKVLEKQTALFLRDKGMSLMSDWLTAGKDVNAVVANNDEMAIGAAMALRQAGKEPGSVLVVGVDGTADGLAAVHKGLLSASVYQDAKGQADGALDAALKLVNKQPVEQTVWVPFKLITPENVAEFK